MAKKAAVKRSSKTAGGRKSAPKRKAKTAKTKTAAQRIVKYPIAETLSWVASGEKLLVQWGAIKSPGAKRIAGTVGQVLSVLEALTALRKS
jgi:hypothetical protein